jgi:hypothetical protein
VENERFISIHPVDGCFYGSQLRVRKVRQIYAERVPNGGVILVLGSHGKGSNEWPLSPGEALIVYLWEHSGCWWAQPIIHEGQAAVMYTPLMPLESTNGARIY